MEQRIIQYFFSALCLLSSSFLKAQYLQGHYIPFGLGYAHQVVKDNSLSPISYSGGIGEISSGYIYQNKNWLSSLDITGFGGFQYPDVARSENNNGTLLIASRVIYSLSYEVGELKGWEIKTGLQSYNIWDYREVSAYGNSSSNYNGLFSLGPLINLQKAFDVFNQNFIFQYGLGLPIGTYYLRPGYIKPFLNGEFSSTGFAFLNDFYLVHSRSDLFWQINETNFLRLSYSWEYSTLNVLNKMQMANHFLSISTIFKL